MKKYLMTWYAMTDFRASLGMEHATGPVLGALLAEDYTDVVILGFTNSDKTRRNDANAKNAFQEQLAGTKNPDMAVARQYLGLLSNTEEAHTHFIQWLNKQLLDAGKKVALHFHPVGLKHLNDTEGIYEAATQYLDAVSAEEGEKLVTLYLSPGTPVMAFVWAFVALRHPNLNKRLIASSQAERPPEEIVLPYEWLEWHGRQVRALKADSGQYDVIFHLFGEQRVPSLLGVLQFSSNKHVFVNSKKFPADIMQQFIGNAEYSEIAVDPYDPENVRTVILNLIEKMPPSIRVGFNLTGGTKLMYAGALAACRKVNATPIYFDSKNNKVIFLNDFDSVDTTLIPSVETFIKLNGNNLSISKPGRWSEIPDIGNPMRTVLTERLWKERTKIAKLYDKITPYNDNSESFKFNRNGISVELTKEYKAEVAITDQNGEKKVYCFNNWPNFAKYLSGGWFEEYTYMKLKPLLDDGRINDLRIGLEVSFKEDSANNRLLSLREQMERNFGTYQELDITFTDGRRLYIIECKAGSIRGEYINKLEAITRSFGGIEGCGIIAGCFPPQNTTVKKKAQEARNVQLIAGKYFFKELEAIIRKGGAQ